MREKLSTARGGSTEKPWKYCVETVVETVASSSKIQRRPSWCGKFLGTKKSYGYSIVPTSMPAAHRHSSQKAGLSLQYTGDLLCFTRAVSMRQHFAFHENDERFGKRIICLHTIHSHRDYAK